LTKKQTEIAREDIDGNARQARKTLIGKTHRRSRGA
jgi:hypothetical protein